MILEILMTIALAIYFLGYYIARNGAKYWYLHIPVVFVAFIMDMYATYLMFLVDSDLTGWIVITHTSLTLIAISLFLVQATLGLLRKRKYHIMFAQRVFLPMWVISYSSGFLFIFI